MLAPRGQIFFRTWGEGLYLWEHALRGVAQDRPMQGPQSAFCALVRRIAETMHKISRFAAHAEGSLRVGGRLSPPA